MKKASKMSGLASAFVILLLLTLSLGANDLALAANPGRAGGSNEQLSERAIAVLYGANAVTPTQLKLAIDEVVDLRASIFIFGHLRSTGLEKILLLVTGYSSKPES